MFGLFKKEQSMVAPVSGKTLDLKDVPDEVFAQRMAGDGLAIDPTGDLVVSPVDGELTMLFGTRHAFGITAAKGIEILVHIGIDTVSLNGEGFEALKAQGDKVKKGEPIIRLDRALITERGYSLITPILLTDPDSVQSFEAEIGIDVEAGVTPVLTYHLK